MGMVISFVLGVAAMAVYRRLRPVPIFRQNVADLTIMCLLDEYTKGESPEQRAASEPALVKNFNHVIEAYSYMREKLR